VSTSFNVLISSAGRRHALLQCWRQARQALGLAGEVLAADCSPLSAAGHAADRFFLVPRCGDPQFVPKMLELCRTFQIAMIIPTIDTELSVYAASRAAFAEVGTVVAVSSPEVVAIGGDKERTHAWLLEAGLPTVRQAPAQSTLANRADWPFPFLVKPRGGSSSIGVAVVRDDEALKMACRGGDYIAQSIAPGVEYTIDILVGRGGELRCAVPRRRLEVRAGEVSKAMTVRRSDLQELAERVCRSLPGAYACLNLQVFVDEKSGTLNVIELNARFGGGFPLAFQAGARYPQWIIEEQLGLPSTASSNEWKDRLVMLRYDDAVFIDSRVAGLEK